MNRKRKKTWYDATLSCSHLDSGGGGWGGGGDLHDLNPGCVIIYQDTVVCPLKIRIPHF